MMALMIMISYWSFQQQNARSEKEVFSLLYAPKNIVEELIPNSTQCNPFAILGGETAIHVRRYVHPIEYSNTVRLASFGDTQNGDKAIRHTQSPHYVAASLSCQQCLPQAFGIHTVRSFMHANLGLQRLP
jgi:hypothetical protein